MTLAGSLKAINFVLVQQQTNSSDCGVFAIAFATCLTFEADPKNNLSNSQNEATFSFMFEKWSIELISLFLVFFYIFFSHFEGMLPHHHVREFQLSFLLCLQSFGCKTNLFPWLEYCMVFSGAEKLTNL